MLYDMFSNEKVKKQIEKGKKKYKDFDAINPDKAVEMFMKLKAKELDDYTSFKNEEL